MTASRSLVGRKETDERRRHERQTRWSGGQQAGHRVATDGRLSGRHEQPPEDTREREDYDLQQEDYEFCAAFRAGMALRARRRVERHGIMPLQRRAWLA